MYVPLPSSWPNGINTSFPSTHQAPGLPTSAPDRSSTRMKIGPTFSLKFSTTSVGAAAST